MRASHRNQVVAAEHLVVAKWLVMEPTILLVHSVLSQSGLGKTRLSLPSDPLERHRVVAFS